MRIQVFVLMMGIAACSKSSPCKQAVQRMTDLALSEGEKKSNPDVAKQFAAVGDALAAVCEQDKWSAEAIDCMKAANDFKAESACEHLLTPEQQKHSRETVQNAAGIHPLHEHGNGEKAAIDAITSQRDRMCACQDAACAEAVNKERDALVKPEKDFMKFNDLDDDRTKCYKKLTGK